MGTYWFGHLTRHHSPLKCPFEASESFERHQVEDEDKSMQPNFDDPTDFDHSHQWAKAKKN